jgi:U2-associated protein SR140
VARLFLVSDLLHNSAAPVKHASTYRTLLQAKLPKIVDHFNAVLRNPDLGRMTSRNFEDRVMQVDIKQKENV